MNTIFFNIPVFMEGKKKLLRNFYNCVFGSFWLIIIANVVRTAHKHMNSGNKLKINDFTLIVLELVQVSGEIFYMLVCINSLRKSHHRRMFEHIFFMENKLQFEKLDTGRINLEYIKLLSYNVVILGTLMVEFHLYIVLHEYNVDYDFIFYSFLYYFQLLDIWFIISTSKMLKRRYEHLNVSLKKFVKIYNVTNSMILQKTYRENFDVEKMMKLSQSLFNIVCEFNAVYGWRIFAIFVCWTDRTLISIYFALFNATKIRHCYEELMFTAISYPIIFIFFTVVVVMACEELKRSGEQVTTTCYILLSSIQESTVKKFLILTDLTEKLTPKTEAAGFYEVDQTLLSTFFSALITYLIVCIQFNSTTTSA
ncbi:hypothetical protein JTB14_023135 [Gonioctena quinquepunctata]|nr:hypothetical protein JTB14_023135 [Gonioctena quinquepunctata]